MVPLKWFVAPIFITILVCVSFLGGVLWYSASKYASCNDHVVSDVTSPNGTHTARLSAIYCNLGIAGASHRWLLTIRDANQSEKSGTLVFRIWDNSPDDEYMVAIKWVGLSVLLVSLKNEPGNLVDVNERVLGPVEIIYNRN